ncbi:hypothetical protein BWI96_11830 [Siphonobacter sp. SORGH_AS_0500]|nr:HipA family kinase [Siphonobacter sp. SORGH_AS_0500]PKK36537.1 hypothetical protein BWI96_11830 [Siphonobacter sp. SORGH_AS_0500]
MIAKEVLASTLATEFELFSPPIALVKVSSELREQLPTDLQEAFGKCDSFRPFFATEYLEGSLLLEAELKRETLNGLHYLDTLYAFDVLIQNFDRRKEKPNVLLHEGELSLIDHEYSLLIDNNKINELKSGTLTYPIEGHLMYPYLKASKKPDKLEMFGTFLEYSKILNVDCIDKNVKILNDHKIPILDVVTLKAYLSEFKANSSNFVTFLRQSLLS